MSLILARGGAQWWLEILNARHVRRYAGRVPEAFREVLDEAAYAKSVDYTLAKNRFARFEICWGVLLLVLALFSGVLPGWHRFYAGILGHGIWASAFFLFSTVTILAVLNWPLEAWYQFRLEERFGFNRMNARLWWIDRGKSLLLSAVLVVPLVALLLIIVETMGAWWWVWGWLSVCLIQCLLLVAAPRFILPLFNKFSPLPEGSLKRRLLRLGERTGFHARNILVMDGSRRSTHSNAFFTGLGRLRQIVLYDTLVARLSEPQMESVLAHEIGHYKKGHIPKMIAGSALGLLAGFYGLDLVLEQSWFFQAFGFAEPDRGVAFLIFALLAGVIGFWVQPVTHYFSRLWEYEADAFAAAVMRETDSLRGALRCLNRENLSNLTPHPIYSRFYYSHPTLLERESALRQAASPPPSENPGAS